MPASGSGPGKSFPIDQELEIAILLNGTEVVETLAVEDDGSIDHFPVVEGFAIGFDLSFRQFFLAHLGTSDGIAHQAFPPFEILAIEKRYENRLW